MKYKIDPADYAYEFEFNNSHTDPHTLFLTIRLEHQLESKAIRLNKKVFLNLQSQLVDKLKDFIDGPPGSKETLRDWAEEGYTAFLEIERHLDDDLQFKKFWTRNFLGHVNGRNRAIPESRGVRVLQAIFPKGISFPLGLLFTKKPSTIDWKNSSVNEILTHFLDIKFIIHNSFPKDEFEGSYIENKPLKNGSSLKILHAIDDSFNTSNEESCWTIDPAIDPRIVYSTEDLLQKWHANNPPRIIHFSGHYVYNGARFPPYQVTLSNHNVFNRHKLNEFRAKPPEKKALFFLNTCCSGILQEPGSIYILTDLWPRYSLGFIATLYNLFDSTAGHMPLKFYEIFIGQRRPLLEAFSDAKRYLILQKKEYSAFGYLIWQCTATLMYEEPKKQPLKRKQQKKTYL